MNDLEFLRFLQGVQYCINCHGEPGKNNFWPTIAEFNKPYRPLELDREKTLLHSSLADKFGPAVVKRLLQKEG